MRYTDDQIRERVMILDADAKEKLIADLGVTHAVFDNWMAGKDKLPNRNKCMHLLGMKMNFKEFEEMIKSLRATVN